MGQKPLKIHVARHGAGGKQKVHHEKNVKCYICGELFNRAYLAKAHEKICSKQKCHGDPKPYKCSVCKKGFVKRDHMLKHKEQSHKNVVGSSALASGAKPTVKPSIAKKAK
uniref:C2H2-type domain-containing protein n=1 Tax=Hemiselmis tepida TaxID=464990 RepID=A0A7S0YZ92_9CRYP|mmetsp:Transcript_34092/g.87411  ORF Transcript_34092/g.87411 Transcript_34092/m.87411 type:complete len:111 (+) Transcript_34092:194-526(+)